MTRILAMTAIVGLAGCGTGGGGTKQQADHSASEFVAAAIRVICEQAAKCDRLGASEIPDCIQNFQERIDGGAYSFDDATGSGRLRVDATAAQACLTELSTYGCPISPVFDYNGRSCNKVFIGLVPNGGTCKFFDYSINECASGWCEFASLPTTAGCAGTCQPFVKTGDPVGTGRCAPTDYVDPSGACANKLRDGGACVDVECAAGFVCRRSSPNDRMGVCVALGDGTQGDPCFNSTPTGGSYVNCAPGFHCDQSTNTCTAELAPDAVCTPSDSCEGGYTCAGFTSSVGHCSALLDLGDTCDPSVMPSACPSDMLCGSMGTCEPAISVPRVGSNCSGADCHGLAFAYPQLYCDSSTKTCTAKASFGAHCTPNPYPAENPCIGGVCDAATQTCVLQCTMP